MKPKDSTPSTFVIHHDTRIQYAGLFLLKEIVEKNSIFTTHPDDDESVLEPILIWLKEAGHLRLNRHNEYAATKRGREHVFSFLERYSAFTQEYDVFSGVDLKSQDFAIRYYNTFHEEVEWNSFLQDERWEDLRIAIAEYQGFDAIEMTFMRFVHNDHFGRYNNAWNFELLLGAIWEEIQASCNNAVRLQSLACQFSAQSPEMFLQDILEKGRKLMQELSE